MGDRTKISVDKCFSISWFLYHPSSVGYLHITSDDVEAPLDFHPGYLDKLVLSLVLHCALVKQVGLTTMNSHFQR